MCIGTIALLAAIDEQAEAPVGRLEDGRVVPLSFVPDAHVGCQLLIHLGIPVEVLDAEAAREALALRRSQPVQGESA